LNGRKSNKQTIKNGWFGVTETAFVTSSKLSYVEPG